MAIVTVGKDGKAPKGLKPGDKVRIGLHREDLLFYAPGETGVSVP